MFSINAQASNLHGNNVLNTKNKMQHNVLILTVLRTTASMHRCMDMLTMLQMSNNIHYNSNTNSQSSCHLQCLAYALLFLRNFHSNQALCWSLE